MKHDEEDNTTYVYLLLLGVVLFISALALAWFLA